MSINEKLNTAVLPPIYKRMNRDCYLDPIRERLIFITPEETIRQRTVSYILNELHVPKEMIKVEVRLSEYGVKTRARADIIIEEYNEEQDTLSPLVVIECKAPEIILGDNDLEQVWRYADLINAPFCVVTNGYEIICYYYDSRVDRYKEIEEFPEYKALVLRRFQPAPKIEKFPRLTLAEIKKHPDVYAADMGEMTPKELLIPSVNLWEALLYDEHKFPAQKYQLFEVINDYGVRILRYGNAAGGNFQGAYRSFLIKYNNSTEFVSIGFSSYQTDSKSFTSKTVLNIAIDNEETTHHSLQLVIDDNMSVIFDLVTFYHHGRIGIGNIGSGRIDELREFVRERYPAIIDGKRFNLGHLMNDRLWNLDDPEVIKLIENLISYALIRDEYRQFVKRNHPKRK